MRQLTIISGKGGTGKTTVAASLATLAEDAVLADCDVDAPDLHLILQPKIEKEEKFFGSKLAIKDDEKCTSCGLCRENCRFDAFTENLDVIEERCEGCGVCEYVCPQDAISLVERESGLVYISSTRFGPMSHAKLGAGEEASGKLVDVVRKNARELATGSHDLIIIDGPPGIGCPAIASITGVDAILLVSEPTDSGIHGMKRAIGLANHFDIPAFVCVNKSDLNEEKTGEIEEYCQRNGIPLVGKLPYDDVTTEAMIRGKTVVEFSEGDFSENLRNIWERIKKELET